METQKIINLLNDSSNEESKFATKNVCCRQSNSKRQIKPKQFYKI